MTRIIIFNFFFFLKYFAFYFYSCTEISRNAYKTKAELFQPLSDRHKIAKCDLRILPELNPPSVMPHGNVGTSTEYFLDLIRTCKLPASVVGKLGLTFPKLLGKRKYSSVPFRYTSGTHKTDSETSSLDKDSSSITAEQSSVDELSNETDSRFRTTDSSAAKKSEMPDSPLNDKNVDTDESEEVTFVYMLLKIFLLLKMSWLFYKIIFMIFT